MASPVIKIASASLTDDNLLRYTRLKGRPILLSTGMSTLEQIDHAVEVLGKKDLVLLHTCSTYPASYDELNLRVIPMLHERYGIPGRVFRTRNRSFHLHFDHCPGCLRGGTSYHP